MNSRKKTMVSNLIARAKYTRFSRLIVLSTLCSVSSMALTGCTALTQPINGVPAKRLPPQFFEAEKNDLVPIDISLLAQEAPRQYIHGPGDILGVTIDKILPYSEPDQVPQVPPVNFPEPGSTLPPSTGFPIQVLEDGTISLPLVEPVNVEGLSTDQVRDKIRRAYIEARILPPEDQGTISPVVTRIRDRQTNVIVVRQDINAGMSNQMAQMARSGRGGISQTDFSAEGEIVQLDAFKNDILNALMETGGLPGVSAKNEVKVIRSSKADKEKRLEFVRNYAKMLEEFDDPCGCPPPMPEDPTVLKIPLRLQPGVVPNIPPEQVILEEGDIVMIETRDTEFFYTGGLLPGGQWQIPRDYDLDVLGAMAIAGYGVNSQTGGGGGLVGIGGAARVVPPGRLYLIRPMPCKGQLAIEIDLTKAINDPNQRPIVKPGDTLVLQYKPGEEIINFGTGAFFTFGIRELLRN